MFNIVSLIIVAVAFIWTFVFRQTDGVLNRLLGLAGRPGPTSRSSRRCSCSCGWSWDGTCCCSSPG